MRAACAGGTLNATRSIASTAHLRPPDADQPAPFITAAEIAARTCRPLRTIQARCQRWARRGWPRCWYVPRKSGGGREWRVHAGDYARLAEGLGPDPDD